MLWEWRGAQWPMDGTIDESRFVSNAKFSWGNFVLRKKGGFEWYM
jgi:hypothetical protein